MLRPYTTRPRLPLFRPRHHGPQLGADLLDRMRRAGLAQRLEPAAPAPGLGDPLPRKAAGLDVGQDALHGGAHLRRHDLRAPRIVAVFRGVADRVPHELHPAAIYQVHDQLQLVHALEVGDLRRVPGRREGLETGLDQGRDAAAQDRLLAEQVRLRLLAERRLEYPRAGAADPRGIRERVRQRVAARILMHRHQRRHAPARLKLAAYQVSGGLRGDHRDIDAGGGDDFAEVHVEPVGEEQRLPAPETRSDPGLVHGPPFLVGNEHHDDVGRVRRLGHGADVQVLRPRALPRPSAWTQSHDYARADPRVPQVERMRVTLAAVTDHGDGAVLQPGSR